MYFPRVFVAAVFVAACSQHAAGTVSDTSTTTNPDTPDATSRDTRDSAASETPVDSTAAADSTVAESGATEASSNIDSTSDATLELISQFIEPYCTALDGCCADAGISSNGIASCEQYLLAFHEAVLNNGSAITVPSAYSAALQPLQTNCTLPPQTALDSVVTGTYAAGTACTSVDECAGDPSFCLMTGNATTGTCVTPRRGAQSDSCLVTCDDTEPCRWTLTGDPVAAAACYDQDGLRCDDTSNTCVKTVAVGSACSQSIQGECGTHSYCSTATNLCAARSQLGDACGAEVPCDTNLECSNGVCAVSTVSQVWCNP
jgi:hypothetical protein